MKILIDDSGSFSWHKPGVSLFAGILLPDRSFVRRDQQIQFWKEWLRNGLVGRSHRSEAFAILEDWRMRDHPFIRKYERDGVMEFSDLYQKHMRFDDSQTVLGLQVADI